LRIRQTERGNELELGSTAPICVKIACLTRGAGGR